MNALALCAVFCACGDGDDRAPYTSGHADLLIEVLEGDDGPVLDAVLLAGGATVDGAPLSGAVSLDDISIRSKARYQRPADDGGAFEPLCAEAGQEVSWLPQSLRDANQNDSPFLGIAAAFDEAEAVDGALDLALVAVDSPTGTGAYSLWQDGFPPRFFMSSCDGIDATDRLTLAPGHDHYNMAFTEPGEWTVTYEVRLQPISDEDPMRASFEVRYELE